MSVEQCFLKGSGKLPHLILSVENQGQGAISEIVCGDKLDLKDQFINIDGMYTDAMDVCLPLKPRYRSNIFVHTLYTKFVLLSDIYDFIALSHYAFQVIFKQMLNIEKGKCFIIAVQDAGKAASFFDRNCLISIIS